jgi:hypothetical protein
MIQCSKSFSSMWDNVSFFRFVVYTFPPMTIFTYWNLVQWVKKTKFKNFCACVRWQESGDQNSGSDTGHRRGPVQWVPHTENTVQAPQLARSLRSLSPEVVITLTTWQVVVCHGGMVPFYKILHITVRLYRHLNWQHWCIYASRIPCRTEQNYCVKESVGLSLLSQNHPDMFFRYKVTNYYKYSSPKRVKKFLAPSFRKLITVRSTINLKSLNWQWTSHRIMQLIQETFFKAAFAKTVYKQLCWLICRAHLIWLHNTSSHSRNYKLSL